MRYFKLIISENGKYYRKQKGLKQNDCTKFLADNYISWIESNTANLRISNYLQYYQNLYPMYSQKELESFVHQFLADLKDSDEVPLNFEKYPNIFLLYEKMLDNKQNEFDWNLYHKSKLKQIRLLMMYNYLIKATYISDKTIEKMYDELKKTNIKELKQFEFTIIDKIIKIIYFLKTKEIYMFDYCFFEKLTLKLNNNSYLLSKIKEIK